MSKIEDQITEFKDGDPKGKKLMDELIGEPPTLKPKTAKAAIPAPEPSAPSTQAPDEAAILRAKIADMEAAIKLLVQGRDNVKLKAAAMEKKPIEWSKLKESDVFDLDVPIDAIDQSTPDYMAVESADDNYVLRWVHKLPQRLGPMKGMGFQECTKEDIKGELNLSIEVNANGQFQFADVILMKIEKRLYYGMLRRNHERALKMVDARAVHKIARQRAMGDIRSGTTSEGVSSPGSVDAGAFDRYVNEGKLNIYAPGIEI